MQAPIASLEIKVISQTQKKKSDTGISKSYVTLLLNIDFNSINRATPHQMVA